MTLHSRWTAPPRTRGAPSLVRCAALLLLTLTPTGSRAQSVGTNWWPDGPVYSITHSGGVTYVGGSFSHVGPATGGGAAVSRTTGVVDPAFPTVAGHIRAVAADGAGGWYVGGDFTSLGGLPRTNLAHVLANGMVDDWNPVAEFDGSPLNRPAVVAIAVSGNTVYIGGGFGKVGGVTHRYIAAVDRASGAVSAWDPVVSGPPWALFRSIVVDSGIVYVGG